jgi:hypothetical protein
MRLIWRGGVVSMRRRRRRRRRKRCRIVSYQRQ